MNSEQRISAFISLGDFLRKLSSNNEVDADFCKTLHCAVAKNAWFTQENTNFEIEALADFLQERNLAPLQDLHFPSKNIRIAVLFSDASPLNEFIDALCVLLSGSILVARLAPNNAYIPTFFLEKLIAIEPAFKAQIEINNGILPNFDAIIIKTTNPSLLQYIKKYPHLIHKEKCSVAVLYGEETTDDLRKLGYDLFFNFGRCNKTVTKLFVPQTFDETKILKAVEQFNILPMHNKYMNNYEYNKSIYLVTQQKHLDNGFLMLKEDMSFKSPNAVVFYEKYSEISDVRNKLDENKETILHVASNKQDFTNKVIPLGETYKIQKNEYFKTISFIQTL